MLADKRRRRPGRLYVFGVQGPIGSGKTTFCRRLIPWLNRGLKPQEGRAITCSLDDYYLPLAQRRRPAFRAAGYAPQGIPNRGPAGTHDLIRLRADLARLECTTPRTRVALPVFDKRVDDRSPRARIMRGRIGFLILEGWFLGAAYPGSLKALKPGLKRSVAQALRGYQGIFNRIDALWVFERFPTPVIRAQREQQERSLQKATGRRGLTPAQVKRFVDYLYRDSWQKGVTRPEPPAQRICFRARLDRHHRILCVRPPLV